MPNTTRISISIEEDIIERFDALAEASGFPTRSEAIKHLIKSAFVQEEWKTGEVVAGVITVVYDHHKPSVLQKITEIQHDNGKIVVCSQHVHIDHHNCLENIIVQGTVGSVQKFHKALSAVKGMKHSTLSMTTTGKNIG
ncbi:MAG: nickel-responsive transcriptional regulator NikR [Planctomycetaceae bacterium]|nr:nickel-responsive transcriptional regulator NikR [Planctomycetaceae bacterium]